MFLPKPSGGDYENAPGGTHIGIAFRLIDLGTQKTNYDGHEEFKHQIMMSWELPEELMKDGRPFTIDKTYNFSMHENSTLRKDLESWRGLPFTDKDFDPANPVRFNLKNVLGKACLLLIAHKPSKDGSRIYANVTSIGKLTKGQTAGLAKNQIVYLTFDEWEPEIFGNLSTYLQGKIAKSPEFSQLSNTDHGHEPMPDDEGVALEATF